MSLLALGLNHRTAPVVVREQVAFTPERVSPALRDLLSQGGAHEAAILSTCNRTELYCDLPQPDGARIEEWLGDYHLLSRTELQPYLYRHIERHAVRHILRVASGLDSMILGEPQILGQVKAAYQAANGAGALGSRLERLFQHAFAVAKQVRAGTGIGSHPVSVAFAAIRLARQIFADLSRCTALLIGAGDTIALLLRHLHDGGVKHLTVANRTLERASALAAPFGGCAIALEEIPAHLGEADIVIAATASPGILLEAAQIRAGLKQRRRPIFMVDLAVPRDIDPAAAALDDVYLYTVDDLQGLIQENLRARAAAAEQAEAIIDHQTNQFMAWLRSQDSAATIQALRQQAEAIRDQALARARRQLAQGQDPTATLELLAHLLTNKLMHAPCVGLREAAAQGDLETLQAIKNLYRLDGGPRSA